MNLTLLGYGKMGKTVERVAREAGHQIVHVMDVDDNPEDQAFSGEWIRETDAIIDFSLADAVLSNLSKAVRAQIPIVVGVTGWYADLKKARRTVEEGNGACIYSSNFSVGVQVMFHLVRKAGQIMARFPDHHPYLLEVHHDQKVDSPSGTAIRLQHELEESYGPLPVTSMRVGFFPGIHVVGFNSPADDLKLEHHARSRDGFARGALFAADWLQGKTGFYSLEEVMFGADHD